MHTITTSSTQLVFKIIFATTIFEHFYGHNMKDIHTQVKQFVQHKIYRVKLHLLAQFREKVCSYVHIKIHIHTTSIVFSKLIEEVICYSSIEY